MNITLLEKTRTLLSPVGVAKSFWVKAIRTACYVINRSPSTGIDLKSPIKIWIGKWDDYSSLYIFCCPEYAMYNAQKRTKLDPKPKKCIILDYTDRMKGYPH